MTVYCQWIFNIKHPTISRLVLPNSNRELRQIRRLNPQLTRNGPGSEIMCIASKRWVGARPGPRMLTRRRDGARVYATPRMFLSSRPSSAGYLISSPGPSTRRRRSWRSLLRWGDACQGWLAMWRVVPAHGARASRGTMHSLGRYRGTRVSIGGKGCDQSSASAAVASDRTGHVSSVVIRRYPSAPPTIMRSRCGRGAGEASVPE
jgi:hypothetical protein